MVNGLDKRRCCAIELRWDFMLRSRYCSSNGPLAHILKHVFLGNCGNLLRFESFFKFLDLENTMVAKSTILQVEY